MNSSSRLPESLARCWPAAAIWALAWALLVWLDGRPEAANLANLAMLLLLASALGSPWLPLAGALLVNLAAVMVFNWAFVPPRGSLLIDLHQHAWLLATMLGVSWSTAGLMARLRRQVALAQRQAADAEQLRAFSEALRDAAEPHAQAAALAAALQRLLAAPVQLLLLKDALPARDDAEAVLVLGAPDADQWTGLWACLRGSTPFGPGTGRYEEQRAWYLPLRGRRRSLGAALLELEPGRRADPALRAQAQQFCDQMGQALERSASERAAQRAREEAEAQGLRNTLLAAISHDYRTPLATIMGAASALQEQDARLDAAQRQRLAATVVDETAALSRLTDNTLQIARLDAPGVVLRMDWESAEEIVGAALRRLRQRHAEAPLRARLEPGLPLLRCDALLLMQLLDNLVDNALRYGGGPVEIVAERAGPGHLLLAVRDRGPGVQPAWQERIFGAFQRGAEANAERPDGAPRRGVGVGLAACRAIARAHGGEIRYRARHRGGASFECRLPLTPQPAALVEPS
ncbi:sensor histidine kinase [Roseateles violae]|uniref:histidine kinase n=1 Tax=Roseateles violae TaxID=3058042 RepID=A0ABT8DKN2_9BURK|nr:ATP-binding protein [Pelomonas sp. PFR6]MDN3918970.1 ATP-binding protein [Pelomonas sp. PFR6]